MKTPVFRIVVIAALTLLTGCVADGYKEFYKPAPGVIASQIADRREAPPPAVAKIERAAPGHWDSLKLGLARRGYVIVGASVFNAPSGSQNDESAIKQAHAVGADLVLILDPRYTGSHTSVVPITTPTASTSYTSGTATAYGAGGSATAYGNATTTTYGSETQYVPITVSRSDYGAIYLVKLRFVFGVFGRELTDAERQELQTNKGIYVLTPVDGSPAFNADILPGDIITAIDGTAVGDMASFNELTASRPGETITVSIFRNGKKLEKQVALGR